MASPFVRRRRLATELRALREERGMTADRLACLIHQSRMKISKLENAHIRPDLAEVMKILDVLGVTGERWHEIVRIARDAAERGWWDSYGDAMGDRQRLYADIESGAKTIREYQPGAMPGILQTADYTWALIEHAKAEGPITYIPERLVEARLQRQRTVLRPGGPEYEVILDEVGLRRFSVPPDVMCAQLHHVGARRVAETYAQVSVRVFPLITGVAPALTPGAQLIIYTFPDTAVDFASQAWIESSIQWFISEFGKEAALREITPSTSDLLPTNYTGTPEQIEALVIRIRDLMSVDSSQQLTIRFFDGSDGEGMVRHGPRAVGHYHEENGRAVIGLDIQEAANPDFMTAVIAHELCHVRLLGERRITPSREDHERLTDLLTIYLGFGVSTTNAALIFTQTAHSWSVQPRGYLSEQTLNGSRNDGYAKLGYLTEQEFGYALACYCWLRGETAPAWATHLDPGPREFLKMGLAYLTRSSLPGDFPTLRVDSNRISISVTPQIRHPQSAS
ncbi:helix-turn-helix domain-containing protein [Actinoallomurus iriomotensis]|uniref:HTH cro/C1-type domain-containing protein n=1 Tax=Actinoallomurus iriomotensis TaxID=478107 RepID=A0A9W6VXY3_9ACTN|nr:helix-turn-helix transcriptional regulator [Actinoallomurus iriomotensis]GLY82296.1 hypothetical protein Airi02_002280 [Actinoallomurus iriomotensis]